jgi:glucose/mannose transport system permease protein
MTGGSPTRRTRRRVTQRAVALAALGPAAIIVAICYYGFIGWTAIVSLTASRLLPRFEFVGLGNYAALLQDRRFLDSFRHLFLFGSLFVTLALALGIGLAMAIDRQSPRRAAAFRLVFLYPLSISWLVTGLVWQWILNPSMGIERSMQALGFTDFRFEALVRADTAIYTVAAAAIWHASGLVMALFLAGLRGIDPDLWRAAQMEGISVARTYRHVVLPILRPTVLTAVLLLGFAALRTFDLVVAMTGGGPGFATDFPAMYVYDYSFARGRLGTGAASAVVLMLTAVIVMAPYLAMELRRRE